MDQTVLRDLSYGVYITGSLDGDRPVGCVANTVFQVTANPVTIGISLNKLNYTERCVRESGLFTLSVLSENTPQEVIGKFGFQSSKDVDKFETFQYGQMGEKGFPVLREAVCSGMLCRVIQEVDVLTHTLFIGQLVEAECFSSETPMTYSYYHQVRKGRTAKNAPTFLEEADSQNNVTAKKYVCSICGYVYEGGKADFEKLPDSWQCPICGVEKEKFVLKEKP